MTKRKSTVRPGARRYPAPDDLQPLVRNDGDWCGKVLDRRKAAVKRTRASEARKVAAGGRRLSGVLSAREAQALAALEAAGYAGSARACIGRALVEAAERVSYAQAVKVGMDGRAKG